MVLLFFTLVCLCVCVCSFPSFYACTKGCFKLLNRTLSGSGFTDLKEKLNQWVGRIWSKHIFCLHFSCGCQDTLAEVEEKYRKAMVSNAQLDNEKNNLMYQVDTLKDSLMELEELLSESQRGYEDKVKVSPRPCSWRQILAKPCGPMDCLPCPLRRSWRERNTPTACFSFSSPRSKRRSNKAKSC